jgi:hypothetical protein
VNDSPSSSPPPRPLEYWHATGPRPLHPVLVALCALGGIVFGALFGGGIGFFLVLCVVIPDALPRHSAVVLMAGLVLCAGAIRLLVWAFSRIRNGDSRFLEPHRRGTRFFEVSFLISSGVGCLLVGSAFAYAAVAS